jgi:hypothetical protein
LAKGTVRTTVKNSPLYAKILANAAAISNKPFVKVGILEGKADQAKEISGDSPNAQPTGLTLVEVATFHEFGTSRTPERSFLRATIDANKSELQTETLNIFKKVSSGSIDAMRGLGILGLSIKSKVQKRIRAGIKPDLDPKTIDRKGSSKPLIDTGQLVNSIQHLVVEKGD